MDMNTQFYTHPPTHTHTRTHARTHAHTHTHLDISNLDMEILAGLFSLYGIFIVTSCVPGTMVIQMKNQCVDIKVLLHQNIQCINILAQAPDTEIVKFVCMTVSRSKIIYNPFYNC